MNGHEYPWRLQNERTATRTARQCAPAPLYHLSLYLGWRTSINDSAFCAAAVYLRDVTHLELNTRRFEASKQSPIAQAKPVFVLRPSAGYTLLACKVLAGLGWNLSQGIGHVSIN